MDAMTLLTIIGALASIGCAAYALWQAIRSRKAANEAIAVRKQLIDYRKASELSQLQTVCKKAQRSMEKYGPGWTPSSLKGVSFEKDGQDVQEFVLLLRENRTYFGNKAPNDADEFCDTLLQILDKLSETSQKAREYGKQILLHLNIMNSNLKKKLDSKREGTH
jgi:hypothetical protein